MNSAYKIGIVLALGIAAILAQGCGQAPGTTVQGGTRTVNKFSQSFDATPQSNMGHADRFKTTQNVLVTVSDKVLRLQGSNTAFNAVVVVDYEGSVSCVYSTGGTGDYSFQYCSNGGGAGSTISLSAASTIRVFVDNGNNSANTIARYMFEGEVL